MSSPRLVSSRRLGLVLASLTDGDVAESKITVEPEGFSVLGRSDLVTVQVPFVATDRPWSVPSLPTLSDAVRAVNDHLARVGNVLVVAVRRGGYGCAVVNLAEQVRVTHWHGGRRHAQGRTAAGGWSQQRYARRRQNQADAVVASAANWVTTFVQELEDLRSGSPAVSDSTRRVPAGTTSTMPRWLVTGGDRNLLAQALEQVPSTIHQLPVATHLPLGTVTNELRARLPELLTKVQLTISTPTDP